MGNLDYKKHHWQSFSDGIFYSRFVLSCLNIFHTLHLIYVVPKQNGVNCFYLVRKHIGLMKLLGLCKLQCCGTFQSGRFHRMSHA